MKNLTVRNVSVDSRNPHNVWFHLAIVYFTALSLKVMPLSESAIRFPSVLVAVANVILVYLIGKRLFGRVRLALLGSALLVLTPAHFIHSRIAMDYLYPVPFVLGWMLLLLIFIERKALPIVFAATSLFGDRLLPGISVLAPKLGDILHLYTALG